MKYRKQNGFTLIEIAIVLLIISLLLGGIVKGQEMINSARVRSIANDLSGIETAWISFQDRYRALPGDFNKAATHIAENAKFGNGDAAVGDNEETIVWHHLAEAGFISGSYSGVDSACTDVVCPSNPYNGYYRISKTSTELDSVNSAYQLAIGENIPVEVLYELDLKIDDGVAGSGRLRALGGTGCVADKEWKVIDGGSDCTAVWLL